MSKSAVSVVAVAVALLAVSAASAAVTAEFVFGTLTASSDDADPIAVTCVAGAAKVNGVDPDGDPAPCAEVDSVEITGGPGANAIDLSGVSVAAFPSTDDVAAFGDEGDDTIAGSALRDDLEGDLGADTLRGNGGDDSLSGGPGDDRLLGGAGADVLAAAIGDDTLDGQAGSDAYNLDLFELGAAVRVADTGAEGTDRVELADCEGVTVTASSITFESARVAVSGIETYPCGFTPPAAPPPPPPAAGAARNTCVVPRLRGRRLARARVLISRAHCSLGKVTRVRSRVKAGVVLRQSPAPGARKPRGTKVSLRVSRGP